MRKTIFVVDDSASNLAKAGEVLKGKYNVITIPSGKRMFDLLQKIDPHLILLDIQMPEMDGFEALGRLKTSNAYKNIPVIFLTATHEERAEVKGFEMGVVDFISKPFSAPVLLNRVKLQIDVSELIKERTAQLEKANREMTQANRNMILVLSDVVENRDKGTGGHIERTSQYIKVLVDGMIERNVYAEELSEWDLEMVPSFALLHDVGKIGVSDVILNKPGKLSDEEFELMKDHVLNGQRIIDKVIARTGEDDFLRNASYFAIYHHESWDGSGYPYGLKGDAIPIQGRIMAIADVYDALISKRPYKEPYTHDQAVEIIMRGADQRFDPDITSVFYEIRDKFDEVASRCQYLV